MSMSKTTTDATETLRFDLGVALAGLKTAVKIANDRDIFTAGSDEDVVHARFVVSQIAQQIESYGESLHASTEGRVYLRSIGCLPAC